MPLVDWTDETIVQLIGEISEQPVSIDSPLSDLQMDSLEYLQMVMQIEQRIGRTLPPDAVHEGETVRDLVKVVRGVLC